MPDQRLVLILIFIKPFLPLSIGVGGGRHRRNQPRLPPLVSVCFGVKWGGNRMESVCAAEVLERGQALLGGLFHFGLSVCAVDLVMVQQNGSHPVRELGVGPNVLGDLGQLVNPRLVRAGTGSDEAAGTEHASGEVDIGAQLGSLGVACNGGNINGAVGTDKSLEGLVREREDRNQGTSFHFVLSSLGGADEHVHFAVHEALLLSRAAVIRNDHDLAAFQSSQRTQSQMQLGQGIAAGHLQSAILGLGNHVGQGGVRLGVDDVGPVVDASDGLDIGTVKVHNLGAVGLALIVAVNQTIAVNQQFLGGGVQVGIVVRSRKAVTAGHVLHDEVIVAVEPVGNQRVLPGNGVRSTAHAVAADDLHGAAAGIGISAGVFAFGLCVAAAGGSAGVAAGIASAGAQEQSHGHNQGQQQSKRPFLIHLDILLNICSQSLDQQGYAGNQQQYKCNFHK